MEQPVEARARRRGVRQIEQPFDAIPERIRVQHESRPRHDVSPIAGLVLLQQVEALVLLSTEPLERERDLASMAAQQAAPAAALRETLVEQRECDEPPERCVDTAQVPEIGFAAVGCDEL